MALDKEKNFVSVVVYLYNAERELPAFLDYIAAELEKNFEKSELIFVNNASEDNSVAVIKEFMDKKKCRFMTSIINMSRYHDIEASMLAGVDLAIGDFVYEFDTTVVDWPQELFMDVYRASLLGDDIVAASPAGRTELSASVFYSLYNRFRVSAKENKLRRESFRIVSRRAINRVKTLGKSVPYRKVMYQNCGLGYRNLEYVRTGSEKRNYQVKERKNREKLAFDTLLMFTNIVQKISMILSVVFIAFTLCVAIYVVCVYFSASKPVEGWAPIMGFLAAGFSGIFIMIMILLKYMSVLLEITFSKKKYLIESIEKINN